MAQPQFTILLTPGQAAGAYALNSIFRTVGVTFTLSGFFSLIIIVISLLSRRPEFLFLGIFPIPVFILAILFFPGIGPITIAIKKNKQRAAAVQHQRQQQYAAYQHQLQQQQAAFQQWQQQKQWEEYQQFLAWKQQQNTQ